MIKILNCNIKRLVNKINRHALNHHLKIKIKISKTTYKKQMNFNQIKKLIKIFLLRIKKIKIILSKNINVRINDLSKSIFLKD